MLERVLLEKSALDISKLHKEDVAMLYIFYPMMMYFIIFLGFVFIAWATYGSLVLCFRLVLCRRSFGSRVHNFMQVFTFLVMSACFCMVVIYLSKSIDGANKQYVKTDCTVMNATVEYQTEFRSTSYCFVLEVDIIFLMKFWSLQGKLRDEERICQLNRTV